MSLTNWPRAAFFDPDAAAVSPAIEELLSAPDARRAAVLVVAGREACREGWGGRGALVLAGAWQRTGRQAVLADLAVAAPELHEQLGVPNGEGVTDVFLFGASLSHVSVPVLEGRARFIPAGAFVPDPAEVLGHRRWDRIIAHFEHAGETLLAFVPADTPGLEALAREIGAAVVLAAAGEAGVIAATLPAECRVLAVLRPHPQPGAAPAPTPESRAAAVAGGPDIVAVMAGAREAQDVAGQRDRIAVLRGEGRAPEPSAPPPLPVDAVPGELPTPEEELRQPIFVRRAGKERPRVSPVLWVLPALALAAGAWVGYGYYQEWQALRRGIDAAPSASGSAQTPAAPAEPAALPSAAGVALRYSVAIEAHTDFGLAQNRVLALREREPDLGFYVAPIVVDSVLYYRVMAGPAADTAGANALMRRLTAAGHKSGADPWSIRPTELAFLVGEFDSRGAALAREVELRELGIPGYVVELPYTDGSTRYRVYSGAFERELDAEVLRRLLQNAGLTAELVQRTGRPAA